MKKFLVSLVPVVACLLVGCGLTAATVAPVAIGVADSICQLASDQGSAEPGWEIWTCTLLDATGKPTAASYQMHLPAGSKVQAVAK